MSINEIGVSELANISKLNHESISRSFVNLSNGQVEMDKNKKRYKKERRNTSHHKKESHNSRSGGNDAPRNNNHSHKDKHKDKKITKDDEHVIDVRI